MSDTCNFLPLHVFTQREYAPDADYMTRQPVINSNMRAVLIDWLVLVHLKFSLTQETLFLTVSLVDRYLSVKSQY